MTYALSRIGNIKALANAGNPATGAWENIQLELGLWKLVTGAIKTREIISSAREKMQVVLMARRGNAASTRRRKECNRNK